MTDEGVCKRCFVHSISYPHEMDRCPIKGCNEWLEECEGSPHFDWKQQVAQFANEEQPTGRSETMRVFEWRLLCLLDAGYSLESARKLAATSSELHQMEDARLGGCPDETALLIFM